TNPGQGAETIAYWAEHTRMPQFEKAKTKVLEELSPLEYQEATKRFVRSADDIKESIIKKRSDAARPHYEAAFKSGTTVDISPVIADIDARLMEALPSGKRRAALEEMKKLLTQEVEFVTPDGKTITKRVPISDIKTVDETKEEIDFRLKDISPEKAIPKRIQSELVDIKERMLKIADEASPE